MGFLAHAFFIFLAVIGVVGAFIGFINPEKLKDKKTGKVPSRLKVLGMSILLFFVGIVGVSAMSETKTAEKSEKISENKAVNTVSATSNPSDLSIIKEKYEKVNQYVKACDSASAGIDAVRKSQKPNFNAYYDAADKASSVCEDSWAKVTMGAKQKFENEDIQNLSKKLDNNAGDYLMQKLQFAKIFRDAANSGRISPEQNSKMNYRVESSLKAAVTLVSTIDEVKKTVGEK